jgi:hypothetical protein
VERELSQLAAHGNVETIRTNLTLAGLATCCGLGQTALRRRIYEWRFISAFLIPRFSFLIEE